MHTGSNLRGVIQYPATGCPDCPATRNGVLEQLVDRGRERCAFRCLVVGARQPLPPQWFGSYGLALVRRGVVVRQRVDADGSVTALDAIGPGGAMPLSEGGDASYAGYAADDALLCLCPRRPLRAAIDAGAPAAAQVVTLYSAALDRVERIVRARSRPTALARVASLLCVLADTLSPPRRLECVPAALQQRDLAALLAMRHESVCRAIKCLARRRVLARTGEGIRLLDRTQLETT
jgi:hypothetical protein